jgi:L-iditol 2-dehydrogenase
MLAAVLYEPNDLRTEEVPTPEPGPGELLIRVGANTICGTDLRIMRGEKTTGITPPTITGHETAGHVEALGDGVDDYEVGAPVAISPVIPCGRCFECLHDMENMCSNQRIFGYAVDGGLAEYVLAPADAVRAGCIFPVAEDLPSEQIALAEPLACCVNGQIRSEIGRSDNVLIMGAGPIGLFHLQLSLLAGADRVIVSEPDELRREAAMRFGASAAVDPSAGALDAAVADATGGVGVDAAIVCVGISPLVNQAVKLCRPGGRINIFAGLKDPMAEVDGNLIHYKELVLTGTSNSRRSNYRTALRLIETGRVDAKAMVTHRFGLASVVEAINTVTSREAIKVAVVPGQDGGGPV